MERVESNVLVVCEFPGSHSEGKCLANLVVVIHEVYINVLASTITIVIGEDSKIRLSCNLIFFEDIPLALISVLIVFLGHLDAFVVELLVFFEFFIGAIFILDDYKVLASFILVILIFQCKMNMKAILIETNFFAINMVITVIIVISLCLGFVTGEIGQEITK